MIAQRINPVELGAWLARERGKRSVRGKPLSGPALARFFNAYIQSQKLPVKLIAQQEISKLETATAENAPKRPQPWWAALRDFIETGALDELIAAAEGPSQRSDDGIVVPFDILKTMRNQVVRTPDGKVVGKIVWTEKE